MVSVPLICIISKILPLLQCTWLPMTSMSLSLLEPGLKLCTSKGLGTLNITDKATIDRRLWPWCATHHEYLLILIIVQNLVWSSFGATLSSHHLRTHATHDCFMALWTLSGTTWWASTRRNIHQLTPILIIWNDTQQSYLCSPLSGFSDAKWR